MPRGGKRQGTPGKAYVNRTDMATNYDMSAGSPAAGGIQAPREQRPMGPMVGADEVPNLNDPTIRPLEPVTTGLPVGPGLGMEAMGPLPPSPMDPVRQAVQALMLISPNPDLVRILNRLDYEGR